MKHPTFLHVFALILISAVSPGCEDLGVPPHILPIVISFSAGPRNVSQGQTVRFNLSAHAELGLARGILDYRDGTKNDTVSLSQSTDSAQTSHTYLVPGIFKPTITIEDLSGRRDVKSDSVNVRINQLPQVINRLSGIEGSVSRHTRSILANDREGDSLTITISPTSPGLIFQFSSNGDSVIYGLTNPDDSGSKQGTITVIDQLHRTIEKVIDIVFAPLDDISGSVKDRFEGTHLEGYKPAAVMKGPFAGWVRATTGVDIVTVAVGADGSYVLPKLTSAAHTLRAFITNGVDSSFVASYQAAPGDRTFDLGVETNAGTGMPLNRLLALYQAVNFRLNDPSSSNSCLVGMDLRSSPANYTYYLVCKDTSTPWLSAKGLTIDQRGWIVSELQARCFAHLPPANRPRIVIGGPNDVLPLKDAYPREVNRPYGGYMIMYANLHSWRNDLTVWEDINGVCDGARIAFEGGDSSSPPYGFPMDALVQMVGRTISGKGTISDHYFDDKTTRSANTGLQYPSIADMKLDWQVIFETPRFNNNVEARYFGMQK